MKRTIFFAVLLSTFVALTYADTLWLGNDGGPTAVEVFTDGTPTGNSFGGEVTGFAWDGSILYSSASGGTISRRTATGAFINSFIVANPDFPSEDMAWDTKRNRLWRVEHVGEAERINTTTEAIDSSFPLPTGPITASGVTINDPGALGITYDPTRDLLYISFCERGCSSFDKGVVMEFDPTTGSMLGGLFGVAGPGTIIGGLSYDSSSDTIWGGGVTDRHFTLGGVVLSSFANPTPFSDGLELLQPVPEPSSVALLLSALAGAGLLIRRRAQAS